MRSNFVNNASAERLKKSLKINECKIFIFIINNQSNYDGYSYNFIICYLFFQSGAICESNSSLKLKKFQFFVLKTFAYLDFEFQSIEQTVGQGSFSNFEVKVKKINKTTRGIFGTVVQHVEIDDTFLAGAFLSKKQGGEYRMLPYNFPLTKICDTLEKDIYVFPELAEASDMPYPLPCPVQPVNFTQFLINHF